MTGWVHVLNAGRQGLTLHTAPENRAGSSPRTPLSVILKRKQTKNHMEKSLIIKSR